MHVVGIAREWLEKLFEVRTVKLLILAIVALSIPVLDPMENAGGAFRLGPARVDRLLPQAFVVVGSLLTLAAIVSGLFELHRPSATGLSRPPAVGRGKRPIIGGDVIMGFDIGRKHIAYGVVSLADHGDESEPELGRLRMRELVPTKTQVLARTDSRRGLYKLMVAAVVEMLNDLERIGQTCPVDGIAVTTPSWIDLRSRSLLAPIGPFPVNESLAQGLAAQLWSSHAERMRHAFTRDSSAVLHESDLASRIYLDEDSRSVIRYDLHSRLAQQTSWENYAYVIVLEGIGAGLVINGDIYYGSHSSEGEVGHTTIHLDNNYGLSNSKDCYVAVRQCDCELSGSHWETIASSQGFVNLANALDPDRFGVIVSHYGRPISYNEIIDVGVFLTTGQAPVAMSVGLAEMILCDRIGYQAYIDKLVDEYALVVTIGLANLANILDLDHVVLGGPIIESLDRIGFRNRVRSKWGSYVLRGQIVGLTFAPLGELWKGAALLFWDPSYHRRMN